MGKPKSKSKCTALSKPFAVRNKKIRGKKKKCSRELVDRALDDVQEYLYGQTGVTQASKSTIAELPKESNERTLRKQTIEDSLTETIGHVSSINLDT